MSNEAAFKELARAMDKAQLVIDAAMDQFHHSVREFNEANALNLTPTVEIRDGKVAVDVRLYFKGLTGSSL